MSNYSPEQICALASEIAVNALDVGKEGVSAAAWISPDTNAQNSTPQMGWTAMFNECVAASASQVAVASIQKDANAIGDNQLDTLDSGSKNPNEMQGYKIT